MLERCFEALKSEEQFLSCGQLLKGAKNQKAMKCNWKRWQKLKNHHCLLQIFLLPATSSYSWTRSTVFLPENHCTPPLSHHTNVLLFHGNSFSCTPFPLLFQRMVQALMLLSSTPCYCHKTLKLYTCPTYFRNPSPITPFIPLSIQVELFHGPSSALQFSSMVHHILHFSYLDFLLSSPQFHKMNLKQLIFLNYLLWGPSFHVNQNWSLCSLVSHYNAYEQFPYYIFSIIWLLFENFINLLI